MHKKKRFFFHYNKPASKQKGTVVWSVHWNGTCFLVDEIKCTVPCESKTNKRQPFAVMRGFSDNVRTVLHVTNGLFDGKNVAYIE